MISEIVSFVTLDKIVYVSLSACLITTIYIKNKDDNIIMSLGWEAMRIFTRLQMYANNMTSWCCDYGDTKGSSLCVITIVKDGKEIKEFASEKEKTGFINETCKEIPDYEFIYRTINDMRSQTITIREAPELLHNTKTTDAPLLMAAIRHNGEEHLVSNLSSFFVVNNRLFNRSFVQWYLNKYYHKNIYDDDYSVIIYTSSGSPIMMSKSDELIIKENGYKIMYNGEETKSTLPSTGYTHYLDEDEIEDDELPNMTLNDKSNQTSFNTSENVSVPSTPPSSTLSPFMKPDNGDAPSPLSIQSQATDKSYDVVNDINVEDKTENQDNDEDDDEDDDNIRQGPKEKGFWSWFI